MRSERMLSSLEDYEEVPVKGKDGLGKGSFASVKLVRSRKDGKYYALKEVVNYLTARLNLPTATM